MTNSRRRIVLASGREVSLTSLTQWAVYAGLLEGLPTREHNDADIDRLVAKATKEDDHPPFLVRPAQRPIDYDGRYPFGEPAALPEVGCIARFRSLGPARDASKDCSSLTVLWFQDDYAFPIEAGVERAIVAVDWDALARDWEL